MHNRRGSPQILLPLNVNIVDDCAFSDCILCMYKLSFYKNCYRLYSMHIQIYHFIKIITPFIPYLF